VIGIEGGNAERQKFRIKGNFRAQVNVLPFAKLFHGFAKGGVGLELTSRNTKIRIQIPPKLGDKARSPNFGT